MKYLRPASHHYNHLFIRAKRLIINLICILVPSKYWRQRIRYNFFLPDICINYEELNFKKYEYRIDIAFCFDKNLYKQAAVAITSLLYSSKNKCNYNIFCIVDDSVINEQYDILYRIIDSSGSSLTFLKANNDFDKSHLGSFSTSIYYRLMLPKLLPNLDEILYADIDVIFCKDLIEASRVDIKDNLIAGVKENIDGYINTGFLILNLKQIRIEKIYDKFIKISQNERFKYPEQDLFNFVCKGRILYMPLKYNFTPHTYFDSIRKSLHPYKEYYDLKYNLVMIHYSWKHKPWHGKSWTYLSEIWWMYARQTGLF